MASEHDQWLDPRFSAIIESAAVDDPALRIEVVRSSIRNVAIRAATTRVGIVVGGGVIGVAIIAWSASTHSSRAEWVYAILGIGGALAAVFGLVKGILGINQKIRDLGSPAASSRSDEWEGDAYEFNPPGGDG